MHPKISYDMSINLAMEFFKYVLYFHIFLLELQMAAIIPILRIDVYKWTHEDNILYMFYENLG